MSIFQVIVIHRDPARGCIDSASMQCNCPSLVQLQELPAAMLGWGVQFVDLTVLLHTCSIGCGTAPWGS